MYFILFKDNVGNMAVTRNAPNVNAPTTIGLTCVILFDIQSNFPCKRYVFLSLTLFAMAIHIK